MRALSIASALLVILAALACGTATQEPLTLDTPGSGLPTGHGAGGSGGSAGTGGDRSGGTAGGGGGTGGADCGIDSSDCSNCVKQGCGEARTLCSEDPTCQAAWTTFQDCACQAELASDVAGLNRCETTFNQSSGPGSQFEICVTVCQSCTR